MTHEPDSRRAIWRHEVVIEEVEELGVKWPLLVVSLFERNEIGERRYIETKTVDLNKEGAA